MENSALRKAHVHHVTVVLFQTGTSHANFCIWLADSIVSRMTGRAILTTRRFRRFTGISGHVSNRATRRSPIFWQGAPIRQTARPNSSQIWSMWLQLKDFLVCSFRWCSLAGERWWISWHRAMTHSFTILITKSVREILSKNDSSTFYQMSLSLTTFTRAFKLGQ